MAFTLVINSKGLFGKVKNIQMAELLKNCGLKYGSNNEFYILEDKDLLLLHEKKLRRMLDVAVMEGTETIILGAFGCGVFGQDATIVARYFAYALKTYDYHLKNIYFSILNRGNNDNYTRFKEGWKWMMSQD